MKPQTYAVRYFTGEEVIVLPLGHLPENFVLEIAAGDLFLDGWCPGNPWCVYYGTGDERKPMLLDGDGEPITIDHYGDSDELWP